MCTQLLFRITLPKAIKKIPQRNEAPMVLPFQQICSGGCGVDLRFLLQKLRKLPFIMNTIWFQTDLRYTGCKKVAGLCSRRLSKQSAQIVTCTHKRVFKEYRVTAILRRVETEGRFVRTIRYLLLFCFFSSLSVTHPERC